MRDSVERDDASHVQDVPSARGPAPRAWLLAVVGLSIAIRLVYFSQAGHGALLALNSWDQSDMAFFDQWGRVVAAGDWLTDRPLHPQHAWHREIARLYFESHPADPAAFRAGAAVTAEEASAQLWNRWYGGKTFHQEPLYPYLVGLTYRLFGPDPRFVFAWQLAFGVLANVLVYLVAARLFPAPVPAVASGLALLCSPLLFYEMVLLRESLIACAGLALVWLVLRAEERPSAATWGGLGVAAGIALLLKSSFLLFLAPAFAVLACRPRPTWAATRRHALALAAGLALALAPLPARNLAVGVPPLAASSVGAVTFVNANTVDYPPEVGFFISLEHAPRIMGESDGRFGPAALAALRTHPGVSSYARQLGGKLRAAWHWYEVPDNCSFYLYRLFATILLLPVTFYVLAPLALLGLVMALRAPRAWPLFLLLLRSLATMLVFYSSSRFRAPLMAAAIPFAALALVKIPGFLAARRFLPGLSALVALGVAFAWTSRPLPPGRSTLRGADCRLPFLLYYGPRMEAAQARSDWAGMAAAMEEALVAEPEFVRELTSARPPAGEDAYQCGFAFASAHANAAHALVQMGRTEEAAAQAQEAARLDAALAEARRRVGR
jgi:4-amino-4-deoxy-L-arabinose transferase-like glycosyltransferase